MRPGSWRVRFMRWWWRFWPGKPLAVQNGVARAVCWLLEHEQDIGRPCWCHWCGAELEGRRWGI